MKQLGRKEKQNQAKQDWQEFIFFLKDQNSKRQSWIDISVSRI